MISLYSRLAQQWDLLFPPDNERITFISDLFEGSVSDKRIIEVGCGTGQTALGLAEAGYSVAASDLDPEMIAIAIAITEEAMADPNAEPGLPEYSVDDMIGALDAAPPASANLILCLGNTLPHLTDSVELARFFRAAGKALVPDGKLVLQILNYPRIVGLGSMTLPDLQGDGIIFRRRQIFNPETRTISFETEVESEGTVERRTHNLNPVTTESLAGYSAEAGLAENGVFCDWNKTPFTEEHPWLAAVYTRIGASD